MSEVEALALAERELPGTAPRLVAVDRDRQVVLMEDLGAGPSLADALLGDDERDAGLALREYVDALIEVHGRSARLEGPPPRWLVQRVAEAVRLLSSAHDGPLPAIDERSLVEVDGIFDRLVAAPGLSVFSIGDMCPDNNVRTPSGLRLFDLEGAGFLHPALDLCSLTLPFPTCWCCFDLPLRERQALVSRYSAALGETAAEALGLAETLFAVLSVALTGPAAVDAVDEPDELGLPGPRARLAHRIERVLERPSEPQSANLHRWLEACRHELSQIWGGLPVLDLAPGFRGGSG